MRRKKRDRGYGAKKARNFNGCMYAPCKTGRDVTDQEVKDTIFWVSRIRGYKNDDMPVTLEMIRKAKEEDKFRRGRAA